MFYIVRKKNLIFLHNVNSVNKIKLAELQCCTKQLKILKITFFTSCRQCKEFKTQQIKHSLTQNLYKYRKCHCLQQNSTIFTSCNQYKKKKNRVNFSKNSIKISSLTLFTYIGVRFYMFTSCTNYKIFKLVVLYKKKIKFYI